jgi:hypothetical protein
VRIAEQHQRINVQVRHLMEIKLRKGSIEHLPAAVFKIEHRATWCVKVFVDLHQRRRKGTVYF